MCVCVCVSTCPMLVVVVGFQVGRINLLPAMLSTFLRSTSTMHLYVDYSCLNKNERV